jgi:hypothetical protein
MDYCRQRFQAIEERIEYNRDQSTHSKNNHNRTITMSTSAVRSHDGDEGTDGVHEGLEIWDRVHPDVAELVLMIQNSTMDPEDVGLVVHESILQPGSGPVSNGTGYDVPSSKLPELFDRLEKSLTSRTGYMVEWMTNGNKQHQFDPSLLEDIFPNDSELDWAALSDILMSQMHSEEVTRVMADVGC